MSAKCIVNIAPNSPCDRTQETNSQYCWQHKKEIYYRYTESIICKKEDKIFNGTYLTSGAYGEIEKAGELIIKNMNFVGDNNELITANIKEACFLSQYLNNYISNLKCIDPDISESLQDSRLKLYLKYSGVTLDSSLYKKFDMHRKYKRIIQNLLNDSKIQVDESGDINSLSASINYITNELNINMTQITLEQKEPDLISMERIKDNLIYIIYQLLLLLAQMEKLDITHNDIKPNNIVIDKDLHVTIIDWGFVNLMSSTITNKRGSAGYTSPEAFTKVYYGPTNDIMRNI